jgi:hypothetical protein
MFGFDFAGLLLWVPLVLVLGGVACFFRVVGVFKKSSLFKGIAVLTFLVGVFLLVSAVTVFLAKTFDVFTWVLIGFTGFALTLKPLSRIPFGGLFGLAAGVLCAGLLYLFFPLPAMILGISSIWIYLVVFFIPALFVFLVFKFTEDVMKLFGSVLGSWPLLIVLGLMCFVQGALLFFNASIFSFIFP